MDEVRIYVVALLKGGARKTTTAMMLAFAWAALGRRVLVIDADTGTQGATDWASNVYNEGGSLPFDFLQWSHRAGVIVKFVREAIAEHSPEVVIIDTGSEQPDTLSRVLDFAHHMVTPIGPDDAETGRLGPTRDEAAQHGVSQSVMLTRVPDPGRGAAKALRGHLEGEGYRVLSAETRQHRELYADVWGSVPESTGAYADAARELDALAPVGVAA